MAINISFDFSVTQSPILKKIETKIMVPIQKFFTIERLMMDLLKIHEVFFMYTHHRDLVVFCNRVNIAIQTQKLNDSFIEFDDLIHTFETMWPGIIGKYIPLNDVQHCLRGMQLMCIKTEFYMINYYDLETQLLECISKFRHSESKHISIGCDLIPLFIRSQKISYDMLNTKCYGRLTPLYTNDDYQDYQDYQTSRDLEKYILTGMGLDQHEYLYDDFQETNTFVICIIETNKLIKQIIDVVVPSNEIDPSIVTGIIDVTVNKAFDLLKNGYVNRMFHDIINETQKLMIYTVGMLRTMREKSGDVVNPSKNNLINNVQLINNIVDSVVNARH